MSKGKKNLHGRLLCGAAALALLSWSSAHAQDARFDIAPQPLDTALREFGVQSGVTIMADAHDTLAKQSPGFSATADPETALKQLLAGTGLSYRRSGDIFVVSDASDPQSGSAAGDGADQGTVQALIVTAQKREENIQDVPIAMSAFTQEDLTRSQVAGGPDLMTQIPNMTFTKTNFSSYSIQIRGIGTQAISATTDAAVAVAFNNTSMIRNHFFEQEFYDLQRVEVLRGPQGTLYGRNATAGVVNIISAKPKFVYEAKVSGDVANYGSTRVEGMINIPLVEDAVALRVAGAWTKRNGFVTNELTGNSIDGRDLWSTRVSLRVSPNDAVDMNLIWEHFQEDDDRLRSGKQLCKRDDRTEIQGYTRPRIVGYSALYNQGCLPASLYASDSFQVPDGYSLPYFQPFHSLVAPIKDIDPYASTTQSRDLRAIESTVDPQYRAESDVAEFQLGIDLTDSLTLTSETAYSTDSLFSSEDYNRFNTVPGVFEETSERRPGVLTNGVFCDPQIGCTDRLVAIDLSTAKSRQFSQELRLSSDYGGPFNFSLGGNFVRYDTEDKYYVFVNTFTLNAAIGAQNTPAPLGSTPYVGGVSSNSECMPNLPVQPDVHGYQGITGCIYIDPNPIGSLNDMGHNYFLSKNPYKLISYAVFGEAYYNITRDLKLTGGLRWTVDRKEAPSIPSWLLAGGGTSGYPVAEVVKNEWKVPTGRVALDWKPDLSFTDETLLYGSYAHGYKAGGANPPPFGVVTWSTEAAAQIVQHSATHPKTFEPEYIDAFEVGAKNTLLDGRMTLNLGAFYYDYKGYQISYIVDRSAVNLNFDAKVWGLEMEADWRPLDNLRLAFKGGYEKTRMADGSRAIDVMDRTAGDPNWIVARPFPTFPSNCILPIYTALETNGNVLTVPPNRNVGGHLSPCETAYFLGLDPVTDLPYVANPTEWLQVGVTPIGEYEDAWVGYRGFDPSTAPNNGEGFYKDLSGHELPNAPHFTATLTADYTIPLPNDWLATLHGDLYYQSEAWTRIFNTPGYDKLKAYTNLNLAAIFTNEEAGWKVMAYVKNVMDRDSITGAFLNSDDSGLTTNVFLTEPRLYGLRITKDWTGGSLLGSFGGRRSDGRYPFTLELGGQVQRHDAENAAASPGFMSAFSPALRANWDSQSDLDWGDGRDVKLTYAPAGHWRVSLGARFGKTNGSDSEFRSEPGDIGCQPLKYTVGYCTTHPEQYVRATNWSQADRSQHEEHTIVDFAVGRDIQFGAFGGDAASELSLGLRYARLQSAQDVALSGIPDWDLPSGALLNVTNTAHRSRLSADIEREFEGAGPVISWDASTALFGNAEDGRVRLDWSAAGGVVFGRQTTSVDGQEVTEDLAGFYRATVTPVVDTHITPLAIRRSGSVTVPTLGASLGLSYKVDRFSVGAGYRWERYFDAIDGGYAEHKDYDRTIDGPYLKIAVGFGG